MTTEDDFRSALDANPTDWQTLLVFADWLRDRGDKRADGYAALGAGRFRPDGRDDVTEFRWWEYCGPDPNEPNHGHLGQDWWHQLATERDPEFSYAKTFGSLSAAFDAAAQAFAKLSAQRRTELLTAAPPFEPAPEPEPQAPKKSAARKPTARRRKSG